MNKHSMLTALSAELFGDSWVFRLVRTDLIIFREDGARYERAFHFGWDTDGSDHRSILRVYKQIRRTCLAELTYHRNNLHELRRKLERPPVPWPSGHEKEKFFSPAAIYAWRKGEGSRLVWKAIVNTLQNALNDDRPCVVIELDLRRLDAMDMLGIVSGNHLTFCGESEDPMGPDYLFTSRVSRKANPDIHWDLVPRMEDESESGGPF